MDVFDSSSVADELVAAYRSRTAIATPFSARFHGFDLDAAYEVEAELRRRRGALGHRSVGRKVGYANKALWRVLKLDTVVWAHMYDDTVHETRENHAALTLATMISPKIEPEIVFKMRAPLDAGAADADMALAAVEWLALGFEIIDGVFADWTFQPADFVAALGFHAALIVGKPRQVDAAMIPELVDALSRFTVTLSRNGELVAEGSGRNSLRSPAVCLAELSSAIARRTPEEPLAAGELVSSGTLTDSCPIAADQIWTATLDGLELPALTLHTT